MSSLTRNLQVIDVKTGKVVDARTLVREESWATKLPPDSQFAVLENGTLTLMDKDGNFVFCPLHQFRVERRSNV